MNVLQWSGCRNVRDLGGLPARAGARVQVRRLVRADSVDRLDEAGRASLHDYGVGRVLDLRSDFELDGTQHPFADRPGYLRIPWIDPQRDDEFDRGAPGGLAARYRGSLDRNIVPVGEVVRAFADSPHGAFLVHCHAGKDRTGMYVALLLDLIGVPRRVIGADYAASEVNLRILQRIEQLDGPQRVDAETFWRTRPETILAALDHLDVTYGGTEPYLRDACGLTAGELAATRMRLTGRG